MKTATLIEDPAVPPIAGIVATKAMEPASTTLCARESAEDRRREDAARPGEPYRIAAARIPGLLGPPPQRHGMTVAAVTEAAWALDHRHP